MDTVKSFFIVEFKTIATGYLMVNSLVQKFNPEVIEIFSQAPAKLIFLFETTKTKEVLAAFKKNKKNILDFYNCIGDHKNLLNALYGHIKPVLIESVIVIESKTLASCFRLVKLACDNPNIKILEIDSGRAMNGRAIAFLTGPKAACENFKAQAKHKNTFCEVLNEMPLAVKSQWAAQG